MRSTNLSISMAVLALIATLSLSGCFGPQLEVLSEQLTENTVKTDGQNDYAVRYSVRVRNKGPAGKVRVMAQLFHPEGTFYRDQIVSFRAGEDSELEFVFTEPTVLGTSVAGVNGRIEMKAVFKYESVR